MDDRKKTLIHMVASNKWGGPQRYALDICRHFSTRGWKVEVFTRDAKAVDFPFESADIPRVHAPLSGYFDISTSLVLARHISAIPKGKGIVHVHRYRDAFTALLARKIAGRPDIRVISTSHLVRKAKDSWLFRRIYRNLDAQIFVSGIAAGRFLSTWHDGAPPFDKDRVHVLHNSLYNPPYDIVSEPSKGPIIAMFHGPLRQGKGLEVLIDAMSKLKDLKLRLRIVGSGHPDYIDSLRRRAISRGVMESIDWHRHTYNPHPLIRESHFGVLPSVSEEAFGLANLEYMANGRPQTCTSNGAQTEYLTDGVEALMVLPGDTQALADAMRKLATDPDLRAYMGKKATDTFTSNFSWQKFVDRLESIYCPE